MVDIILNRKHPYPMTKKFYNGLFMIIQTKNLFVIMGLFQDCEFWIKPLLTKKFSQKNMKKISRIQD
jgi:hypothetical protein